MYKIGVFPGGFRPPTRGHLNAILHSGTRCEKLYVVVSDNENQSKEQFKKMGFPAPSIKEKAKWLSQELQNFEHIKVLMLDETDIPSYPEGWEIWSQQLHDLIPEHIDVIFGGEPEYKEGYTKYFPDTVYEIFDSNRSEFPISATMIRSNPYKYWDYILGSARSWFAKRVLIVGVESCGKTSLTKMLAKIFHTAWAEEVGRYYSRDFLGGNEEVFTLEDFYQIALRQRMLENEVLRQANKIVFFDTEALITQYYCELYLGEKSEKVESLIDPSRYDLVLYLRPDVKWVDDELRKMSNQKEREKKDKYLYQMFIDHGFEQKMVVISGDYEQRLNKALELSKGLLGEGKIVIEANK